MPLIKTLTCFFMALFTSSSLINCEQRLIRHEPQNAAIAATKFAYAVLISNDLKDAIQLMAEGDMSSKDQELMLLNFISKVKYDGSEPETIWATEYEPVPGTYFVRIFLVGKNSQERTTFYSLTMESKNAQDYKVVELRFNGTTPFAASPLRKSF